MGNRTAGVICGESENQANAAFGMGWDFQIANGVIYS